MKMKKLIMSLLFLGVLPINMMAQDDMYFVPSKEQKAKDVYAAPTIPVAHAQLMIITVVY